MRVAAQCAVVFLAALPALFLWRPWTMLGLSYVLSAPAMAVIAWYVVFTMPRELVDRHAAQMAAQTSAAGSPANARGLGLS